VRYYLRGAPSKTSPLTSISPCVRGVNDNYVVNIKHYIIMPEVKTKRTRKASKDAPVAKGLAKVSTQDKYADRLQQMGQGGMPLYKEIPDTSENLIITVHEGNPKADGSTSNYLTQGTYRCAIGKGLWDEIQDEDKGVEIEMTLVIQEPIPYTEDELKGFMPSDSNRNNALASYRELIRKDGVRYCAIAFVE